MSVRRTVAVLIVLCTTAIAQVNPNLFQELRWRSIGPYRGGRVKAVAGVPQQPNVFYFAQVNGGVWKTIDYGHAWFPIFDDQPTGSVGAIAVAPSDPNVIYVGSGEGLHRPDLSVGDGVYKSTDAGKTWTHLGLRDGQQIPMIAVDPRDPNKLFVAVLGHPYGPNKERGIFRSTDGGQTFTPVLQKDENTGGSFVDIDPKNPDTVYACMWEERQGPWENGAFPGTGGGIFKSTDGGANWTQLKNGLPDVVQANLAIAPSNPNRIYATVAGMQSIGVYRSEDAGASWTKITDDQRPAGRIGGGDLSVPRVDPKNPDVVYITSTVSWKSVDGGKTWNALRGAPGGDDYQNIWINPNDPNIILIGSDQGTVVSVNGGETWSDWYNQPTAQMYHVAADNAFPYRLCSGQQESGSACVSSRGNDGEITMREWHPVAADEYSYVAPDPNDPDIVYGGKVTRYDRRTTTVQAVSPKPMRSEDFRMLRTEPVQFSPKNSHALYFAGNTLWKTTDGGTSWTQISPDLSRKTWDVPATVGKYKDSPQAKPTQRGVIYSLGLSPLDENLTWAGTDDGLIHLTRDGGKNWSDVTPPTLQPWMKVSIIDAGHYDANTAYAAINTLRLDDMRPHILRTHDGGKTWTEIVNGISGNAPVNVVREDPKRKGLLYAGTETQVWVSFDDGDHWQSLRQNMPATSIRDLIIKDDDVAVGTHGRGFWILDNVTPLRQLQPRTTSDTLFTPQTAMRVRWNTNSDTPLPPEVPAGQNPPDGAMIDYNLAASASGAATIEIDDASGKLVRKYASTDPVEPIDPMLAIPKYWPRPQQRLSTDAGMHRFLWDMHYTPLPGIPPSYPIAAVAHNTAPAPTSPWVMPGQYTVKLTVNGKTYSQPLTVKLDPRVKTPAAGINQQFTLSKQLYDGAMSLGTAIEKARTWREALGRGQQGAAAEAIRNFEQKLDAVVGREGGRRGGPPAQGAQRAAFESLNTVRGSLVTLMDQLQSADVAPTQQQVVAATERVKAVAPALSRWQELQNTDVPALNQQLKSAGLPELK